MFPSSAGKRALTVFPQYIPNGRATCVIPKVLQSTGNPIITPSFVLADASQDEPFDFRRYRRASRRPPIAGTIELLSDRIGVPSEFAAIALEKGWGIIHPIDDEISEETSTYAMIYGPRNRDELETVWIIAQISCYQARGLSMKPYSSTAESHAGWG